MMEASTSNVVDLPATEAEDEVELDEELPEEPPAEKPTPPMQIPLPGDWSGIGTEFGGRQPDTSEIRLLGGKMPIQGSFPKGTVLDLHVRVKVTGVLGQDTVDAFGQEEATIRRHMARMISVRRLDESAKKSSRPEKVT
jgi:hypothetical protein